MGRALLAMLFAASLGSQAPVFAETGEAAFYDAAYARCVKALTTAIKPAKGESLIFAAVKDVLAVYGDEYGVSFPAGAISRGPKGAIVASAEVGSCWGVPGRRSLHLVILNGQAVSETLLSF